MPSASRRISRVIEAGPGATCDGKVAFDTWHLAATVNIRRSRYKRHFKLSVYRCPFCKRWHRGNSKD